MQPHTSVTNSNEIEEAFTEIYGHFSHNQWKAQRFALSIDSVCEVYDRFSSKFEPKSLLQTLAYLSNNPTQAKFASDMRLDIKTIMGRVDSVVDILYDGLDEVLMHFILPNLQIHWEDRLNNYPHDGPLENVTHLVDVTVVKLYGFDQESANWKNFYSKKHKFHCWKFTGIIL